MGESWTSSGACGSSSAILGALRWLCSKAGHPHRTRWRPRPCLNKRRDHDKSSPCRGLTPRRYKPTQLCLQTGIRAAGTFARQLLWEKCSRKGELRQLGADLGGWGTGVPAPQYSLGKPLCPGVESNSKGSGDPMKWEHEAGGAGGAQHTGRLVWATSAPRASFTRWNAQLPSQ